MEQLLLFGKIIYWKNWTKYLIENIDSVRLANYDDIPECKKCKLATSDHPVVYCGNNTYNILCILDVKKLKLVRLSKMGRGIKHGKT